MKVFSTTKFWPGRCPRIATTTRGGKRLIIPWPIARKRDEDDNLMEMLGFEFECYALFIDFAPWWLTTRMLRKEYRAWARWHQAFLTLDDSFPNPAPAGSFDEYACAWYEANPEPPRPKLRTR